MKWDPKRENAEHFRQSAMLLTIYYWVQVRVFAGKCFLTLSVEGKILVHRPFIPKPGEAALLDFPSLAISSNAARSCIRVLDVVLQRKETSIVVIPSSAVSANLSITSILN